MTSRAQFVLASMIAFALMSASFAAAQSHARIVRLSSIEGQVQMDRGTGQGLERAILNTPILEGTRLVTGSDGLAEVEFENQSALRLTTNSEIKFDQLLLNEAGDKVNQIEVIKGIVYLDTASKGQDSYRLMVGDQVLLAGRDTLLRIDATSPQVQTAVFKGGVQFLTQTQPVAVQKKETLTFDPKNTSAYAVKPGTEAMAYDAWNKEREAYASTYAQNEGYGGPNHAYGLQDLNYYGDYFYASGYGYVWQPYGFANAMMTWNPYSNGAWMSYPGAGYMWASAYPWGWLPYHYGSWAYIKGTGWAWMPGNSYRGQWYATSYQAVPKVAKAPAGWTAATPPANTLAAGNTVPVGNSVYAPAYISGGRIPPSFGSVVPGRTVATSQPHGFVSRDAMPNRAGLTSAEVGELHHPAGGHVFAAPMNRATALPMEPSPGIGPGSRGIEPGLTGPHTGMAASATHSSSTPSTTHK